MSLSTRALEAIVAGGSSTMLMIAEATPQHPDPMSAALTLAETLAKASPSVILATFLIILWRRYTAREDSTAQLTRDAIEVMQEVRDELRKCSK